MPNAEKARAIEELTEQLSRSQLTIVADYRGLSVGDLQGLRGTLRPLNAQVRVAKNTLTNIAANRAGIDVLNPILEGPTALVFAYGDVVSVSKSIGDFARSSRILTVRGGVMNNRLLTPPDVEAIATLPSIDELRGRLVGLLASPMARTVGVLSGPSRSIAYVLQARIDQRGGAPEAEAAD
jgi:large subunit ribosomal protein L10